MTPILAHARVAADGATPDRWMLFLHGILGSGANWRTFARRLVAAKPEWGAVLVDLRLHGDSQPKDGAFGPPHTLRSAAHDIEELVATLPGSARGILAHSFGGKVGLELAKGSALSLSHFFLIDSNPGARPTARGSESTRHIVDILGEVPEEFADRQAFTAWIEQRGVSRPVAMWLAMNVRPLPNTTRYTFRIDLAGVRELLDDYFREDLWSVLERPSGEVRIDLVVGGKSSVLDADDIERARRCPRTTVHVIEDAGHWVHADAPDALFEIVQASLG